MSQPPPVPLEYRSPLPPPPPERIIRTFAMGLFVGIAISALLWLPRWKGIVGTSVLQEGRWASPAFWGVISLKIVGGIMFLFIRGYRYFGVGLITSLLVGVLISFFGMCYVKW